MLIEFSFKNYRSFRDQAVLSMEAVGLGAFKSSIMEINNLKLLRGAAIFGKNGGGKSNVIRAFWLAVQFIRNAQRTQHEKAEIPVNPFALNDYSDKQPTEFSFVYILDGIKYWYSFSATRKKVVSESLYHAPKGQKAIVFTRENQKFTFTESKSKRTMISEAVAENQLFFSVACTMNDKACINAMRWFREFIYFSRDYTDIPAQLLEYAEDQNMLKAISDYAKEADFGIENMKFEFNNQEIDEDKALVSDIPDGIKAMLLDFKKALSAMNNESEVNLRVGQVTAKSEHYGIDQNGNQQRYVVELSDESDGTRRLMSYAPAIESVLSKGGLLLVDELEKELHPMLVNFIISKFQSCQSNTKGAQIIFTTHNTDLMNLEFLRKDQIYLVDKKRGDGVSELYSIADFNTKTGDNIRKGYLMGKYGGVPDVEPEEVG